VHRRLAGPPRGRPGLPLTVDRRLLAFAGLLAVLSLGLPWGTPPDAGPGFEQPARVLVPVAGLLVWWAVRHGSRRIAWAGPAVAVVALATGGTGGAGRILLAAAVLVLAAALLRAGSANPAPQPAARLR
jgi:hypothetical protein